jgi:phosphoenolpyruvate carboxykinase (GTP)
VPLNPPEPVPAAVRGWVAEVASLTRPGAVHWCDGSMAERDQLYAGLASSGTFADANRRRVRLRGTRPQPPHGAANPGPRIYSCSENPADVGPTELWAEPATMRCTLARLFDGCMRGRTMYVVPFLLSALQDDAGELGIELTDSRYVVVSLAAIARTGRYALDRICAGEHWVPSVHSVGYPLVDDAGNPRPDVPWPCNDEKWIAQFPDSDDIWSYGTGFGAAALVG